VVQLFDKSLPTMFSGVPRFRTLLGPVMSISRLGLRVLHTHMMLLRSKLQFVAA